MNSAPLLSFPGSRALASWWDQLSPLSPTALWVGHLFLRRVEAPVLREKRIDLDPLLLFVLRAIAMESAATIGRLQAHLCLDRPFLGRLLESLKGAGLVQKNEFGQWDTTTMGLSSLAEGGHPLRSPDRGVFYFHSGVEDSAQDVFLPLRTPSPTKSMSDSTNPFDISILRTWSAATLQEKRDARFPLDVHAILDEAAGGDAGLSTWQRIIVERSERLPIVWIVRRADDGSEHGQGFALKEDPWSIDLSVPVLELGSDWREVLGNEFAAAAESVNWSQAWLSWCQQRSLPTQEGQACRLHLEGCRLEIRAPGKLVDRLRATKNEILRGEHWFVAGTGRIRAAAVAKIVE